MSARYYEPEVLKRLQGEMLEMLDDFIRVCEDYHLEYFGIAGTGIGAIRHHGFIPWDDDIDIAMRRRNCEKLIRVVEKKMGDRYLILNAKRYPSYPLMTTRLVKRGTVFVEEVMREVDCPFGIFLDIYVLDNVEDQPLLYQIQSWSAWFFSKLMILRAIPRPTLQQRGWKARVIWAVCGLAHRALLLPLFPAGRLRDWCEFWCRLCDKQNTRRMAFLPDTSPYWNVVDRTKCYPLKKLEFEGRRMNFPANLEEMLTKMYGNYMELPPEDRRKTHYPWRLEFSAEAAEEETQ